MIKRLFMITLAVFMLTSLAVAQEIGGIRLPDSLAAGRAKLLLNGAGFRKKWFVKVYVGGLYLMKKNHDPQRIMDADESMAVRLHMVYGGVTSKKMTDAMDEGFLNATGGNITPIKDEIDTFNSFFAEEIKENDVFDLIYIPGEGVSVSKNEKHLGAIKGFDFKKALFGIWLCEKPADKKLKKGMLGR